MKKTVGGNRLGAGNKLEVNMDTYNRSTHNLNQVFRSTMAPGTLVPFFVQVGLPGDTWDIKLAAFVNTHPTIGPLFGSYKLQLDVFWAPIRLYHKWLHQNKKNIGMHMERVLLPQLEITGYDIDFTRDPNNQQINPSCIFKYLGMSGIGKNGTYGTNPTRWFNAAAYLQYFDQYGTYYANQQEGIGAIIHQQQNLPEITIYAADYGPVGGANPVNILPSTALPDLARGFDDVLRVRYGNPATGVPDLDNTLVRVDEVGGPVTYLARDCFNIVSYEIISGEPWAIFSDGTGTWMEIKGVGPADADQQPLPEEPQVYTFPLENIDAMKDLILGQNPASPLIINSASIEPYSLPLRNSGTPPTGRYYATGTQEGLLLKTYQSDMFNSWMDTAWIDGTNGINEVTAVDTTGDKFEINALVLAKSIWDILNRVGISGGSYYDWLEVTYTADKIIKEETPLYMGGLSQEVIFQEVISNSESGDQPLGTLGGRGVLDGGERRGGNVTIKPREIGTIMGIVSLTPRIDYSQGNSWDTNLKTMNDFHKPGLDQIGFQELITDQMAFWDTDIDDVLDNPTPVFKSAGKQPSWVQYTTNVNKTFGNFAIDGNEMFMTLNRRYEWDEDGNIKDLTTYIDPMKFNNIFAQTSRDAMNFWVQIGVKAEVRRVMSAKEMPNL